MIVIPLTSNQPLKFVNASPQLNEIVTPYFTEVVTERHNIATGHLNNNK